MHDPVADMLTRIRNGQQAKHQSVKMISSNLKVEIAKVLKEEGYVNDYSLVDLDNNQKELTVDLKYYKGTPVIDRIKRISRPGLRVYKSSKELMPVPGFGISIVSTSTGVMTNLAAKEKGIGGELLCEVA
jgi:small subunit ribosomal protein S8